MRSRFCLLTQCTCPIVVYYIAPEIVDYTFDFQFPFIGLRNSFKMPLSVLVSTWL